ncbi:methyl-accepting chemotaxis protein [Gracilinema caldarium]|uniref:Methyl-accepting chemotaxis sensory transducer n=1 Tax=Gracilinema caldarium (strain ATCC 51460 / DSM 7334 / H1) TaxID=744872 RepID=F8EXE1_GRAC1|nr:HAMP domain-containing methyl-accepting chemotaxis protein [Gracilinema caldarium]AEJ19168.1 methyl-accepting chemotaxis sensory transducer [Gracilinema caldarium DSM 7334]
MKIFAKLLSGIGLVLVLMTAVVTFVGYQAYTIYGYLQVSKQTTNLIYQWDQVLVASYQFLTTPETLDKQEERLFKNIDLFSQKLDTFVKDKRVKKLGKDAIEQRENTVSLWNFTLSNLEGVRVALEDLRKYTLEKYPIIGRSGNDGIQAEVDRLIKAGQFDYQANYYFDNFKRNLKSIALANEGFKNILNKLEKTINGSVSRSIQWTIIFTVFLFLVSVMVAIIYTISFARRIAYRTQTIEASLRQVAQRDFSTTPPHLGKDEIGMISVHLKDVIESVGGLFTTIKHAASRVTGLKEALSAGSAESAAAINQINKNIENIKNQFVVLDSAIDQASEALADIGKYLENFKEQTQYQTHAMEKAGEDLQLAINQVSQVSQDLSKQSQDADYLRQLVIEGADRVQSTNEIIKSVSRDVENISEIIELIDQISEQTNILSMNAAIESAHAGAAGAGFAVVADEIRKLAESTQDNAQRIEDALSDILAKINQALEASSNSAQSLESISTNATTFVKQLDILVATSDETNRRSIQVGQAIQDSITAIKGYNEGTQKMYQQHHAILDAMENIKSISDQTLAGITEIDQGSREILESIVNLEDLSQQSREGAAELEKALAEFKTSESVQCADNHETNIDERGVEIKKAPITL